MTTGSFRQPAAAPPPAGFLSARDARGSDIDLTPILPLLQRVVAMWRPERIWLFGSRARGEAQHWSDWDLFAVVPDDIPADAVGPLAIWRLRKELRIRADVVPCHASDFHENRDTPNTIAYEVAREGVILYER